MRRVIATLCSTISMLCLPFLAHSVPCAPDDKNCYKCWGGVKPFSFHKSQGSWIASSGDFSKFSMSGPISFSCCLSDGCKQNVTNSNLGFPSHGKCYIQAHSPHVSAYCDYRDKSGQPFTIQLNCMNHKSASPRWSLLEGGNGWACTDGK